MRARTMSGVVGLLNMSPFLEGEVSEEWSLLINIKNIFSGRWMLNFWFQTLNCCP